MGKPRLRSHAAAQARAALAASVPLTRAFTHTHEGPLLVLLFASKPAQLDALARIETYYEGNVASDAASRYLSGEEVRALGACGNYVAFNFTVRAVREWLGLMWADLERRGPAVVRSTTSGHKEEGADAEGEEGKEEKMWWEDECSVQERHLLRLLHSLGCLDDLPFGPPRAANLSSGTAESERPANGASLQPRSADATSASAELSEAQEEAAPAADPPPKQTAPTYLISALASQPSDLTHERLHALFHLSPSYAHTATALYASALSPKVRAAVEWDLAARGYRREMYADEWQAYVSEDPGEFGGKARAECEGARGELRKAQEKARRELGLA